tara:strand:- start:71 stop:505 length:435 start_codon:yes stop_codon:yes gene_type:complete
VKQILKNVLTYLRGMKGNAIAEFATGGALAATIAATAAPKLSNWTEDNKILHREISELKNENQDLKNQRELLKKEIFRLLFQQNSNTISTPQQNPSATLPTQSNQNLIYAVIPADGTDNDPYPKVVYVSDPNNPGSFNTSILDE